MNSSYGDTDSDHKLVEAIQMGDESAFRMVFEKYQPFLCAVAADIVKSHDTGKDIVQDVFLRIWIRRQNWHPVVSLKAYLYRSVCNESLNTIKQQKNRQKTQNQYVLDVTVRNPVSAPAYGEDVSDMQKLSKWVWEIAQEMPERRYLIFTLHKLHGLTYDEISTALEVAPKTVENQIGKAYDFIRSKLKHGIED